MRGGAAFGIPARMAKSKVAVLKVKPASILDDIERLCELADMKAALDPSATTIL